MSALLPKDIKAHARLGISRGELEVAQVQRVTDEEAREQGIRYRGALGGIFYPRLDPWERRIVGGRVRRDTPEMENGEPKNKYLSTYGDRPHLYLSVTTAAALADTTLTVVFVEAEKSALMLAAQAPHVCAIGLGGCWGWKGTIGKTETPDGDRTDEKGPSPDFDRIAWSGRDVVIWLDTNVTTNPKVQAAERALAGELARRGARVRLARIPSKELAELAEAHVANINGPDDYAAAYGDVDMIRAVSAVLLNAAPYQAPRSGAESVACESVEDHLAYARLAGLVAGMVPTDLEERLRRLRDSVAGKDALRVRLVREAAIAALKAGKVPGAAGLVDAAIQPAATTEADAAIPTTIINETPWPEPVDGAALLDALVDTIRAHVVLSSPAHAVAMALWVLVAWCHEHVSTLPILTLSSPVKRCGKSTTLGLVGNLAPRALLTSSITASALFRAIEKWCPTLLIDEADTTLPGNDDLRCMLNAGHTKTAAVVVRCVGDDHEPTLFSVWCPKVLAMIGRPPDTVLDRSILIELRRKTRSDRVSRRREDTEGARLAPLRQRAMRWAQDTAPQLRAVEPELPAGLHDRAADNWRPLVAIADLVGGDWPALARQAAAELSGVEDDGDMPIGVLLLMDLKECWPTGRAWCGSAQILDALHAIDDRPWKSFGRTEKPITGAKLARLLRPFGIAIDKFRDGPKTVNGYHWTQVSDAVERYTHVAPPLEAEQQNSPTARSKNEPFKAEHTDQAVPLSKAHNRLEPVAKFRRSASTTPLEGDEGVSRAEVGRNGHHAVPSHARPVAVSDWAIVATTTGESESLDDVEEVPNVAIF